MNRKRAFLLLAAFLSLGTMIGIMAYAEAPRSLLRFFWSLPFLWVIKVFCAGAFALLILKWLGRTLPAGILKWIYGIVFLPILLLPLFRCWFKVPYVFCRVCPAPCPWGLVRTFAFNTFLLLNLRGKFWCQGLCPFGTFQECQAQVPGRKLSLPGWLSVSSFVILLAVAGMYLLTLFESRWAGFFESGGYRWGMGAVLVALAILLSSFFIPKFWCRYFCPVGTIAELSASLRGKPAR
ncbi:MAG TPA: 4Fe-4S binding protein [Candidatus Omnitrophota bacterium]|nr:4Fe-4S binding protein [Candidatus Omnitrophota bacterium]HPS36663.1 4Fe-4S binding protein [Candidatus Omnitrophota bacterium]